MKQYLLLVVTMVLYGIGLASGYYYYRNAQQIVETQLISDYEEKQALVAANTADHIESLLTSIKNQLTVLSEIEAIYEGSSEDCNTRLNAIKQITQLPIANLARTNSEGIFDCTISDSIRNSDALQYDYIRAIGDDPAHMPVLSNVFTFEERGTKRTLMAVHVPLFNRDSEFTGTLGGSFYIDSLVQEALENTVLPEGGFLVLITSEGDVLYHPTNSFIGENIYSQRAAQLLSQNRELQQLFDTATKSEVSQEHYYTVTGTLNIGSVHQLSAMDTGMWSVLISTPLNYVLFDTNNMLDLLRSVFTTATVIMGTLSILSLLFILRWNTSLRLEVDKQTHAIKEYNTQIEKHHNALIQSMEQIKREKELSKSLAADLKKFKMAVDDVDSHVVITDRDGIILYANKAVKRITGFDPQDILGEKAGSKKLWGGLMGEKIYKKFWHRIKIEKKTYSGEFKNKKKSGEEYIADATISPVLDEKDNVLFFIGIERDITHAKEVDRAKTEFVSLASHQLRTPLSAINWYSELLLSGDAGPLSKEQNEHLDEIYLSSKRMVELVNALLNVSRIELGTFIVQPEPTDIVALMKEVLTELKVMSDEKHISIHEKCQKLPNIDVDPKLTRIIFQNLLSNAVKYTPPSGGVSISIKLQKKGTLFHGTKLSRSMVTIVVSDTGYGIPKRQQHLLFQKLFRADNAKEKDTDGTGLGLYIVKSIIEHSDGFISFTSVENKGTSFYVAIPSSGMTHKEGTRALD